MIVLYMKNQPGEEQLVVSSSEQFSHLIIVMLCAKLFLEHLGLKLGPPE